MAAVAEGWHPAHKPVKERTQDEFIAHVSQAFALDLSGTHPRQIVRSVLAVLEKHITGGETLSIKHVLPAAIRELLV